MPLTGVRIANIEKASAVRTERARVKKEIKAKSFSVPGLLVEPDLPAWAVGWEVGDLLSRVPRRSLKQACTLLQGLRLKVSPTRMLGELTYRQRREIAAAVEAQWEGSPPSTSTGRRAALRAPSGSSLVGRAASGDRFRS
jgi:hypothetical protein